MIRAICPVLLARWKAGARIDAAIRCTVAAS